MDFDSESESSMDSAQDGDEQNVDVDESYDEEEPTKKSKTTSKISVASSSFGNKEDSENEGAGKSNRGKAIDWVLESEFTSMVEFDESPALQDLQENYNMNAKKTNKEGHITRNFVCKFSKKKKGFACPVRSKTVFAGDKMTIYKLNGVDHKHAPTKDNDRKNFNFSQQTEGKIKELLELNVNSRNIRKHLIENGFFTEATAPSEQVFYSKTYNLRKKLNLDRKKIGLREFKDLIESHSAEPDDPAEPFIVRSKVDEDETGKLRYSVMFSSRSLIQSHMKSGKDWLLSVDATYQTNTEDCPLIFFGQSAKDGKFNGIGAILSNREDQIAYNFLFDFVKNVSDPVPSAIMADADKAITASVKALLPRAVRLTCFFHVMKNVKQRLARVENTDYEICVLQTSTVDEESFLALYNLLKKKWLQQHIFFDPKLKIKVNEFIEYFTKTWVNFDERNWYQAADPQHLTTNNNVEGTNHSKRSTPAELGFLSRTCSRNSKIC